MKRILRNERGIALAVANFALVVVGALVAGALFAGLQEQRLGENTRRLQQSFAVAEAGAFAVVRNWDPGAINIVPRYPGGSFSVIQTTVASKTGSYGGAVYKLNDNVYLVDIAGSDTMSRAGRVPGGGARQRVGLITRIRPVQIDIQASLTTRGAVTLKGSAYLDGGDHTPNASWGSCDLPGPSVAGLRTADSAVTGAAGRVSGAPPVLVDTMVKPSTFTEFGEVNWAELASRANITLSGGVLRTEPVVTGGICDKSVLTNWGDGMDRTSPCGNYFPIVHITGDATLNGVQGQGILLVEGDLWVQGGYEFFGIAIIKGTFKTAGGGATAAHFWGGVMAQNAALELNSLSGDATLNYSKCAIRQVLALTSVTAPLRSRSWVQLF